MRPTDSSIHLRQKQHKLLWRERAINQTCAQELQAKVNMIDAESRRQERYMNYQKKLLENAMGDQRSSGSLLQSESLRSASSSSSSSSSSSVSSSSSETSIPPPDDLCCKIHGLSSHCRFYPCQEISDYHSIRDISQAFLVMQLEADCFVEDDKPRPLTKAQHRVRGLRYMTSEMRKQRYSKLTRCDWTTNYGSPRSMNINKVTYTISGHP